MNAITSPSTLAMQHAEATYRAIKLPDPDLMVATFINAIKAGWIKPSHMVDVQQAMHAALVDRFPKVALFMEPDLESVGDSLCKAIKCAEDGENYYPEGEPMRK